MTCSEWLQFIHFFLPFDSYPKLKRTSTAFEHEKYSNFTQANQTFRPFQPSSQKPAEYDRQSGFFLHQNNTSLASQFLWPQSCVKEKQRRPYPFHRLSADRLGLRETGAPLNSWPRAAVCFQRGCQPLTPLHFSAGGSPNCHNQVKGEKNGVLGRGGGDACAASSVETQFRI